MFLSAPFPLLLYKYYLTTTFLRMSFGDALGGPTLLLFSLIFFFPLSKRKVSYAGNYKNRIDEVNVQFS